LAQSHLTDRIRHAGLRCTPARETVLDVIESVGVLMSHAQLLAHGPLQQMDQVTLYRTLAALNRAGLVHRVQGENSAWRYGPQPHDHVGCPGNHVHFLCVHCGTMNCLADQPLPHVAVPHGATVQHREYIAYGTCDACSQSEEDRGGHE
jgi:Fur family transcriptional regulator, ferric uptake regulator